MARQVGADTLFHYRDKQYVVEEAFAAVKTSLSAASFIVSLTVNKINGNKIVPFEQLFNSDFIDNVMADGSGALFSYKGVQYTVNESITAIEALSPVSGSDVAGLQAERLAAVSAALDFPSVAAGGSADLTMAVPGAALGDVVALGIPNAAVVANTIFMAWVSATDVVSIRIINNSAAAVDPVSGTFKVRVYKV